MICVPACDEVLLDGRPLGESPVYKRSVAPGERVVSLRWSEPPSQRTVRVRVQPGDEPTVLRQFLAEDAVVDDVRGSRTP